MIIFNLDGTLADCEHRRHFVDPKKQPVHVGCTISLDLTTGKTYSDIPNFKPDWQSFYEACDKDKPIYPAIISCRMFDNAKNETQIWSGRSESVREKTEDWLEKFSVYHDILKMRPIGNTEPDEVLKERWLDKTIAQGNTIDFVFDSDPKSIAMWRRRGIYAFNCCQHDNE